MIRQVKIRKLIKNGGSEFCQKISNVSFVSFPIKTDGVSVLKISGCGRPNYLWRLTCIWNKIKCILFTDTEIISIRVHQNWDKNGEWAAFKCGLFAKLHKWHGISHFKISAACMLNILSCLIVFLTNQLFVFCVKNDDFHDGSQV